MSVSVICVALFSYSTKYASCIETQRAYAEKHGYEFELHTHAAYAKSANDAAWLKLSLVSDSIKRGRRTLCIDADCDVNQSCPKIETVENNTGCIYMAKGRTKRFNSGVIYALPDHRSETFFESVLKSRFLPVSKEDTAPYENGHIIAAARCVDFICELPFQWNNSFHLNDDCFIRHYTGPMRDRFTASRHQQ